MEAPDRTARALQALNRKLERWELAHLRQHVEELRLQLDAQLAELAETKRQLSWAEDCADRWRDDALNAIADAGCLPGITITGAVVALPQQGQLQ